MSGKLISQYNKLHAITTRIHGRYRERHIHVRLLKNGGYAEWVKDSAGNIVMVRWMLEAAA